MPLYHPELPRLNSTFLGGISNGANDSLRWVLESQIPQIHFGLVKRIKFELMQNLAHLYQRPAVAMGYSGGFMPLAEAIKDTPGLKVETMVGLGAANTNIPSDILSTGIKIIQGIIVDGPIDIVQELMQKIGATDSVANQMITALQRNLLDEAFNIATETIARAVQSIPWIPNLLPDLSGTALQRVVNVWGSKDIMYEVGAGGYKPSMLGVDNVYNIEIVGATHFDYMRRDDEKDPAKQAWNNTVSGFVTDLILASSSDEKLSDFFNSSSYQNYISVDPNRPGVRIVQLPGSDVWQ